LLGGSETYLLTRRPEDKFYWMKSCMKVNIYSGELQVMSPMTVARYENMSACHMGIHIYVIGGIDSKLKTLKTSARFNLLTNKWTQIPNEIPTDLTCGIASAAVKKRFILMFGGKNWSNFDCRDDSEVIIRIDTLNLHRTWTVI